MATSLNHFNKNSRYSTQKGLRESRESRESSSSKKELLEGLLRLSILVILTHSGPT